MPPSGAAGCGWGSTTTKAPPTVEPEIQAVRASSQDHAGIMRIKNNPEPRSTTCKEIFQARMNILNLLF